MNHLLILLISIPCVLGAECQRGDTSCSCETDTGSRSYFSTFKFISKSEKNSENTYSAKCGISRNQCGSSFTSKIPAPTCCKNCCKSTECTCKAELCIYPKCPLGSNPFTGFTGKEYKNTKHDELTADKCGCGDSNLKQCLIGQICSVSNTKPKTCNCCSKGGTVTMNGQCTCRAGGATCSSGGLCTWQNGDYGPDGCKPPGSVTATCSYPSCPMDGYMWEGGKTIPGSGKQSKECRCLLDDSCVNTNDENGCKTWYKYPCKCSSTTNCDVGYVCNGQTGACTKCTDVSCDGWCSRGGDCDKGSAGEEGTGDNSNSNSNSGGSSPTCTADELTTMQQCVEKVSAEMQNTPTSTSDSDSSSKSDSDSSSSSESPSIMKPGGRALDSSSSDSSCKLYQDMLACYPACYCDDSLNENKINDILASNRELALSKGITCTLKCGGSSSSSGDEDGDKASHATKMMLSAFAIASVVIAASFSTHHH